MVYTYCVVLSESRSEFWLECHLKLPIIVAECSIIFFFISIIFERFCARFCGQLPIVLWWQLKFAEILLVSKLMFSFLKRVQTISSQTFKTINVDFVDRYHVRRIMRGTHETCNCNQSKTICELCIRFYFDLKSFVSYF